MIVSNSSERSPAISLTKVMERAPDLVNLYKAAGSSVRAHGLEGVRAAVYLVLDRSGSMRPYYRDGTMQHLAEQALSLSAHLDDDGVVPVVFFSTDVDGSTDLRLGRHRGLIDKLHENLGHMGRTNYHWAMDEIIDHYIASGSDAPALVVFQTDGGPTSRLAAERYLCKAARLPLFWQFIGFGDPDDNEFTFLHKLDTLAVPARRIVDNAGFFHAGRTPRTIGDNQLYDRLLHEFPQWLAAARTARVLE
ncbi:MULTISPECIES: VWA domain-containing protein [unclassified Streptomyces]|uniref:vWA domain-containing protein n=1 Tax=unclassified Streptomyces TaxID=2593676 RepID=UPI0011C9FB21|nr:MULTISPECIES: VWA domain-containing protein [unclassified Streptomyces]TXS12792.1 VWA domain-containing protein [Streptomyces sp. wa22]WSQ75676.1 VWA domain-containing protein [Streptomyces sp. NBC_01213]WSR52750.1 VWA domain-containing protein [Streptomyces sp. NBC_01201]